MSINTSSSYDYEYINESEIDNELKCVICRQPLRSPVSLSACNHTFCKACIKTWLTRNQTCPVCREGLIRGFASYKRSAPYVPINTRIVLNQLDRLLVRCLLCNETNIQRCHWSHHEKNCLKKTVSCPSADIKCTWEGSRDTLPAHLTKCAFQQVRPIIDELRDELTLTQTTQNELKDSVQTLERKVAFLLGFINNGNIMKQKCDQVPSECKYNTNDWSSEDLRFLCSFCNNHIRRDQIALHSCSGNCICRSCVHSQFPQRFYPWEQTDAQNMSFDWDQDD